nr:MAG TPA: hypothetical protein [Caudoviricetes sp.]
MNRFRLRGYYLGRVKPVFGRYCIVFRLHCCADDADADCAVSVCLTTGDIGIRKYAILIVFGQRDEGLVDFDDAARTFPRLSGSYTTKELGFSGVVVLADSPVERYVAHRLCSHAVNRAGKLVAVAVLRRLAFLDSPRVLMDVFDLLCGRVFEQGGKECAGKVCGHFAGVSIVQLFDAYCANFR